MLVKVLLSSVLISQISSAPAKNFACIFGCSQNSDVKSLRSVIDINDFASTDRCHGQLKMVPSKKYRYRISANSFRGNYSFLNLTLCTVTFGNSTYRCGNYSREETIQGRKLFAEIRYGIFGG